LSSHIDYQWGKDVHHTKLDYKLLQGLLQTRGVTDHEDVNYPCPFGTSPSSTQTRCCAYPIQKFQLYMTDVFQGTCTSVTAVYWRPPFSSPTHVRIVWQSTTRIVTKSNPIRSPCSTWSKVNTTTLLVSVFRPPLRKWTIWNS
jgi:hypothetical protein